MASNGKGSKGATIIKPRTFKTSIDISSSIRDKSVELLNQQLADSLDLYSQLKQAHWNIKGKDFYQLHLLFDTFAEHAEEWIDEIAERATELGGYATGTVRDSAENSSLPEYPHDAVDGVDHVKAVVERLAAYAASSRKAIDTTTEWGDTATADLLTEITRGVDKDFWFAEAHLHA
ncbi:DNA starvation/stationary phase protection protein Dps [soil metagenome]